MQIDARKKYTVDYETDTKSGRCIVLSILLLY